MAHPKTTKRKAARAASRVLRGRYSRTAKSAAGSALSQKHGRRNKK